MTIKGLLKTSGLAALATAMTVVALPTAASAQNGGWGEKRSQERSDRGDRGNRGDRGGSWGGGRDNANRGEARSRDNSASRPAPVSRAPAPRAEAAPRAQWSGGNADRRSAPPRVENRGRDNDRLRPAEYRGNGRSGNDDRRANTARQPDRPSGYAAKRAGDSNWRDYNDRRNDNRGNGWDGKRNDRDRDRGKGWSGGGNRGDGHYNGGRHDGKKWDGKRWDRKWRDNSRYNWSHYRNSNRNIFRIGTYYSPYRNYYYRPLNIGFFLDSLFYSNRYWINDPWQYRLPEVYGPYRWVRYYDDVLLVDIYSGEVVDVIRNFFW